MSASGKTHLIRLTLKRDDAVVAPLMRDLMPTAGDDAMGLHHRLLWTLYAGQFDNTPGQAPFLWRRMDDAGRFMVLGPAPAGDSPYFKVEAKPFDVRFREGQRLAFELRLNATTDLKSGTDNKAARGRRTDIVLAAMHRLQQDRPRSGALRLEAAQEGVAGWMHDRAAANGFEVGQLDVTGYRALPPPKRNAGKSSLVGICDIQGVVRVTEPAAFMARLCGGFGRMKAYGCGLMLVRPVR